VAKPPADLISPPVPTGRVLPSLVEAAPVSGQAGAGGAQSRSHGRAAKARHAAQVPVDGTVARHVGEHAYFAEILEQSVATFRLEQPTTSPLSAEKAKTLRSKKQTRLPAEKLAKFDDASSTSTSFGAKYVMEAEPGGAVRARYVDFVYQPIDDEDGRVTGIFVEGHDVTAQKEAEIALSNNAGLREQFIAVLGHDLRNPLAAISGRYEFAAQNILGRKGQGYC
jgi:hypothetical protein